MITFHKNLTQTKYNGYFWDVIEKKLYSIKINGVLKEMKKLKCNKWFSCCKKYYYAISNKGKRRYLCDWYLDNLKLKDSEIPFKK